MKHKVMGLCHVTWEHYFENLLLLISDLQETPYSIKIL
jgi:hypothetical protein